MSLGGSIESVAIDGRLFSVASDADVAVDKGGKSNEIQMNGNGTARLIQTRKAWMLEGVNVALDPNNDDLGYLQNDVANGRNAGPDGFFGIEITMADGRTWNGRGALVGDLKAQTMSATASLSFSGPGQLSMQ